MLKKLFKMETSIKDIVTYFINIIKIEDKKFNKPEDVYAYLKNCLKITELNHGKTPGSMTLPNTDFNSDFLLYYAITEKQAILIALNGAYGIFQSPSKFKIEHLSYYRDTEGITLISMPSSSGKTLWQK